MCSLGVAFSTIQCFLYADSLVHGELALYFMNIDLLKIGEVCTVHPNLQQSSYFNVVSAAYAE